MRSLTAGWLSSPPLPESPSSSPISVLRRYLPSLSTFSDANRTQHVNNLLRFRGLKKSVSPSMSRKNALESHSARGSRCRPPGRGGASPGLRGACAEGAGPAPSAGGKEAWAGRRKTSGRPSRFRKWGKRRRRPRKRRGVERKMTTEVVPAHFFSRPRPRKRVQKCRISRPLPPRKSLLRPSRTAQGRSASPFLT